MKKCVLNGLKEINIVINDKLFLLEHNKIYEDFIASFFPQYFPEIKEDNNILNDISNDIEVIIEIEE